MSQVILNPSSILITGASSGIGTALAERYARQLGMTLFLAGRDEARLNALAERCKASGADVYCRLIDVCDEAGMAEWIAEADTLKSLDLVIANAGISMGDPKDSSDIARHCNAIFSVNMQGVLNTIHPALALMVPRSRGQIAIISSLAGYHGMPSSPAYSASKVCVRAYGEGLRGVYGVDGIAVNVVMPGFVRTSMTDKNDFSMPFLMSDQRAAKIIVAGLKANKGRIAFPWPMVVLLRLLTSLPYCLLEKLIRRLPKKS